MAIVIADTNPPGLVGCNRGLELVGVRIAASLQIAVHSGRRTPGRASVARLAKQNIRETIHTCGRKYVVGFGRSTVPCEIYIAEVSFPLANCDTRIFCCLNQPLQVRAVTNRINRADVWHW